MGVSEQGRNSRLYLSGSAGGDGVEESGGSRLRRPPAFSRPEARDN
jgi:hypothetical protein